MNQKQLRHLIFCIANLSFVLFFTFSCLFGQEQPIKVVGLDKPTISQVENQNIPGGDYKSFELKPGETCQACIDACLNDPNCKAYTYVKPGIQRQNAVCWLKSTVSNPVADPDCISGVKGAVQEAEIQSINPAAVSTYFKINSVELIREQAKSYTSILITNVVNTTLTKAGNIAYSTGNGVVLDLVNVTDTQTGSTLNLKAVSYGPNESDQIKKQIPPSILLVGDYPVIDVVFNDISTTSHLYLLTLGTNVDKSSIDYIRIGKPKQPMTPDYSEKFILSDQIVSTLGSSELRVLFTCTAYYYQGKYCIPLQIKFKYSNSGSRYFHHIQLVQLD